ncbi:CIC11C00000000185 [Sungouiella intermedia]|uniref:CIC11C00000000185 n=1 Tax=Sungouiella intermedia TaxID=45354 RepID=A0A1L0CZ36_9ASCO|nr:CIC11C00000000185 [[Candida] intermedia]
MKLSAVYTILSCALAVSAIPVEAGMDEATNAMVQSSNAVINAVAANVATLIKRKVEPKVDDFPRMVGEPTYFIVEEA